MSQQIGNENNGDSYNFERQDSTVNPGDNTNTERNKSATDTKDLEKKSFFEQWKNNRFWLIKGSYYLLRSVWMIVMTIGGIIVWLISLLFI